jgi:hypothetical protein
MDLDNSLANSHTHCQAAQANAQTQAGKECVCPNTRPKRSTNQRTKKNTEAITSPIRKQGFGAS